MTDPFTLLPLEYFTTGGKIVLTALLATSFALAVSGAINLCSPKPHFQKSSGWLHGMTAGLYVAGFLLICWFHYCINRHLPLELPAEFIQWLNLQLQSMNAGSPYPLPLYDALAPPRYTIPVWIENEKYYFWFLCYALLASIAYLRIKNHRLMGFIHLILAIQTAILFFGTDPFTDPLPQFFREISPWFSADITPFNRLGLFMRLYPKMIFYYNAHYMWFHPPLLFISYACITLTFAASVFMLINRELSIETLGYGYAKMGYFVLTLGMLLGYPWALQAWGPNWWWDPKICSSLMMWAIYSTYLHTRLYANKPGMWYFSSALGILCFLAMIFTFISSFFFPGEHTFQ